MAQNDFSFLPFGAGGIPANENSGTSVVAPRWYSGTASPTAGTYVVGDTVFNCSPVAATLSAPTIIAWVCTTGGTTGGTWQAIYGEVLPSTLSTTATSGTLTNGYSMTLLNPASTGTYSLPSAAAALSGYVQRFKNIASGSVTLTPLGSNGYDTAAITLAQNAVINIVSVGGGTTWYKAA